MALLHTGDRICASCGGMNGRHQSDMHLATNLLR